MSEGSHYDEITHRLVIALDALPVPEEPTGLSATARPPFVRTWRTLLVAVLVLAVVTTLASPQFQDAAASLIRSIERGVLGAPWVGYYHDHSPPTVNGLPALRVLIATGDEHGAPTTPEIAGEFANSWGWSPDRQQMLLNKGSQLYLGDANGRVRLIADVGVDSLAQPLGWVGNDKVWALLVPVRPGGPPDSLSPERSVVTVDVRTGVIEHVTDDLPSELFGPVSPDGRWLSVVRLPPLGGSGASCGNIAALYDLASRQTVDLADASGRPVSAFGFLSDGRIVLGQCDRDARTLELHVGTPSGRPSLIAVVALTVRSPVVSLGNRNDEILVITSGPEEAQDAYVFDPSGRLLRREAVPKLALAGTIGGAGLSSDGRFMSFDVEALVRDPVVQYAWRAGVVDLKTGQVTYLCASKCDYLYLR
jgi:hypothetical protein